MTDGLMEIRETCQCDGDGSIYEMIPVPGMVMSLSIAVCIYEAGDIRDRLRIVPGFPLKVWSRYSST